ncbi:hypothetical protein ACFLSJ_08735, partial [Verrucomicrobiota bacterium]
EKGRRTREIEGIGVQTRDLQTQLAELRKELGQRDARVEELSKQAAEAVAARKKAEADTARLSGEAARLRQEKGSLEAAAKDGDGDRERQQAEERLKLARQRAESEAREKAREADAVRRELESEKRAHAETRRTAEKRQAELREALDSMRVRSSAPVSAPETRPEPQWHVRFPDGSTHGPVSVSELVAWARECRVGPDQEASRDRRTWVSVKSLPDLKMEWMVKLVDGTPYGPFNAFALEYLISDGVLDAMSEVTNRRTGQRGPAYRMILAESMVLEKELRRLQADFRKREASRCPPKTVGQRARFRAVGPSSQEDRPG